MNGAAAMFGSRAVPAAEVGIVREAGRQDGNAVACTLLAPQPEQDRDQRPR